MKYYFIALLLTLVLNNSTAAVREVVQSITCMGDTSDNTYQVLLVDNYTFSIIDSNKRLMFGPSYDFAIDTGAEPSLGDIIISATQSPNLISMDTNTLLITLGSNERILTMDLLCSSNIECSGTLNSDSTTALPDLNLQENVFCKMEMTMAFDRGASSFM